MKPKSWLLKLGMGIALLTYLVVKISPEDIAQVIKNTNLSLIALLFLFVPFLYLIRGYKWRLLLNEIGISTKFWQSCKIVLMGTFYGILTPAKSGELTRVYFLPEPKARTLPTVLWDKIIDLFALLLLSIVSIAIFFLNKVLLGIVLLMLIVGIILVFTITNRKLFLYFIEAFSSPAPTAELYFNSVEKITKNKAIIFKVFLLSLLYYAACALLSIGVLYAIDPSLSISLSFALPFIILLGNAPITVSGIGLRESASVFAFVLLGAPASQGLLFAFMLFLLITLFPGMIGFLFNITQNYELITLKNIPGNYYNKHTSKNPLVRFLMAKFNLVLDELFIKTNAKKVLDVGCGEGYTTQFVKSKHNEISICGIDIEEGVITLAKRLHPEINFSVGNVYKLHFGSKSFDLVIANEVLEHLNEPEKAIKEIKRVSRGYCIISVPNEPYFRIANMFRLKYVSDLGNTPGHVQNYTKKQFENLLKMYFSEVDVKTSVLWNIALCKI